MPDNNVTTPGSLLIKSLLSPKAKKEYDETRVLDKKGVNTLMVNIIKNGGSNAHNTISDISSLFFNTATEHGYSTPLSDYLNESSERDVLLKEFSSKVDKITSSSKTKQEQDKALHELSAKATPAVRDQNLNYLLGKGSTAAKMALTGARGNATQLQQGTSSPLMAIDIKGAPIPVAIKSSFAEGLTPAEHLAMSYGGRSSTVKTQLSTSLPGAIFKKLTPNLYHEVVTIPDCNTTNGTMMSVKDGRALVGRYTAGTNRYIDEAYYKRLSKTKKVNIKIRSTLTCEAKDGVCQKCYGISSDGILPEIGSNIGVVAAQSISEVLTQAVLSTKHTGGVAGKARSAFDEADNLLKNPNKFIDESTISTVNGKIDKIDTSSLGDHTVTVSGVDHFIPRDQNVLVKKRQAVKQGDPLSTGMVNPRQLVNLRGLGTGRKHMATALRKIYEDDGHNLDPRHFDLVSKNLIKWVDIKNPGTTGFMPGQRVSINEIEPTLKKDMQEIPLSSARGKTLAHSSLELTPGTILDANHIDYLRSNGIRKVKISNMGLSLTPIVPGLLTSKNSDSNWLSRLAFTHLSSTIQEASALGLKSDTKSTDPITPYIVGTEFGDGSRGKY